MSVLMSVLHPTILSDNVAFVYSSLSCSPTGGRCAWESVLLALPDVCPTLPCHTDGDPARFV